MHPEIDFLPKLLYIGIYVDFKYLSPDGQGEKVINVEPKPCAKDPFLTYLAGMFEGQIIFSSLWYAHACALGALARTLDMRICWTAETGLGPVS